MAISSSVQFMGSEAVLNAYEMRKVAAWSMWQGRQFLFKYEGDNLEEGLKYLDHIFGMLHDSPAVYTLKVYEEAPSRITEKTPCDGSFNFRLNEPNKENLAAVGGGDNRAILEMYREVKDENKELRKTIEAMQSVESGEGQSVGAIGVIQQVMAIPGVPDLISGLVARFFNPMPVSGTAAIAGVPTIATGDVQEITQQQAERLVTAFMNIKAKMPDALEMLEKLATIANQDPAKFGTIQSAIKMFL